jgi:hypothetical protein
MELDVRGIEAIFGIKPRDWKREIERRLKAGMLPQPGERSLAAAGYPELYRVTIFLTDAGLERWTSNHTLRFPPICCLCGAPAAVELETQGDKVPHCAEHGSGRAGLMIENGSLAPKAVWITLTGRHEGFLQQTVEANADGDVFPPWAVFPQYDSYSGFWKQGGQFWITRVFDPFWKGLDELQKAAYLRKWPASPDWREWLNLKLGA